MHAIASALMFVILIGTLVFSAPSLSFGSDSVPTPVPTAILDTTTAALEQARTFTGTHNTDWTPFATTFPDDPSGASMVLVPIGTFQMGSDAYEDEQPIHPQTFTEPYWIDQTEVTRAQYRMCVEATACTETRTSDYSTRDTQPINRVTWFQARAYCAWRGETYHLPTEREWEYAARGVESWIYPWGNNDPTTTSGLAVYYGGPTHDVGSLPDGASWVGALDLSGNVREWVTTIYGIDLNANYSFSDAGEQRYAYPYVADDGREMNSENRADIRILRGGEFDNLFTEDLRSAAHYRADPGGADSGWGFRCVRS